MIGRTNTGGGGGGVYALIVAEYPEGSLCTASNGSKTLRAKGTSGSYVFKIPSAGTWTVSCTDGSQTASTAVTITTEGQSESVALSYALYLFKSDGAYSGTWEARPWWASGGTSGTKVAPTFSASDLLQISATQSGYTVGVVANNFSFDSSKPTLECTWQNYAASGSASPAIALSVIQPYADGFTRVVNSGITTASGTAQLDISALTSGGQYYFGFLLYKPAGSTLSVAITEVKLI